MRTVVAVLANAVAPLPLDFASPTIFMACQIMKIASLTNKIQLALHLRIYFIQSFASKIIGFGITNEASIALRFLTSDFTGELRSTPFSFERLDLSSLAQLNNET